MKWHLWVRNDSNDRRLWLATYLVCIGAVFFGLCWTGVSHCSYSLNGDAAGYFGDMCKIRNGYLSHNVGILLDRFADGDAEPIKLRTEGGYACLLYLASILNRDLPFLLNGFIIPGLLLAFMILVYCLNDKMQRGCITALVFLVLVLLDKELMRILWFLTLPLRSPVAHLLGVVGLIVCVQASRQDKCSYWWLVVGGLSIGLAAWSRVPNILFVIPASVHDFTAPGKWRFRMRLIRQFVLASGLLLGLLPLFAQNKLEGKLLYETGMMELRFERLAKDDSKAVLPEKKALVAPDASSPDFEDVRDVWPRGGLHYNNFKYVFPETVAHIFDYFNTFERVILFVGLIIGLFRKPRLMIFCLLAAVSFVLIYAFYGRVVDRYLVLVPLFLTAIIAIFFGDLICGSLALVKHRKSRTICSGMVLLAWVCIVTVLLLRQVGDIERVVQNGRDSRRFETWLQRNFDDSDVFICNRQRIITWLSYLSEERRNFLVWDWSFGRIAGKYRHSKATRDPYTFFGNNPSYVGVNAKDQLDATLKRTRVFFISSVLSDGTFEPSWWRDDLMNHYDLTPVKDVYYSRVWGRHLVAFEIAGRHTKTRELEVVNTHARHGQLFVIARDIERTNRWQDVELSYPDWSKPITGKIQQGPNFLDLPSDRLLASGSKIEVSSSEPLPSLDYAEISLNNPITIDMRRCGIAPTLCRFFSEVSVRWVGYHAWWRDWIGARRSRVSFMLDKSSIRLPVSHRDLVVRLYYRAITVDRYTADQLTTGIRYSVAGKEIRPSTHVCFREPSPLLSEGESRHAVEFVHKLTIPAVGKTCSDRDMTIVRLLSGMIALEVHNCQFLQIGADVSNDHLLERVASDERLECQWPMAPGKSWRNINSVDPTFRMLDGNAAVDVDLPQEKTDSAVLFSTFWPDSVERRECEVGVFSGDRALGTLMISSGAQPTLVCLSLPKLLVPQPLVFVPQYAGRPRLYPVVYNVKVLNASCPDGIPMTLSVAPDDPLAVAMCDFWPPFRDSDGSFARWTKAQSFIDVPIHGEPRDLTAVLTFRGPPRKVENAMLCININSHHVASFSVRPMEDGVQAVEIDVASNLLRAGINRFSIGAKSWQPSVVFGSRDERFLGVCLKSIEWRLRE